MSLPFVVSSIFCFSQAGKISFEDAILARQNLIKENRQKVSEIKQEVCSLKLSKFSD